jgi:transcriptional regulator with XRE-family HTH domain
MRLGSLVGTVRRKATMTDLDIPKLVKELRERLGLTQEQFAQKVGVTYGSVNHWENGKRRPQPFLVRRLLEIKEELDVRKK